MYEAFPEVIPTILTLNTWGWVYRLVFTVPTFPDLKDVATDPVDMVTYEPISFFIFLLNFDRVTF